MSKTTDLSRRSLRRDQILEFRLAPLPEPPPEMMKLPGVARWWEQMVLMRRRDTEALYALINNLQVNVPPVPD